jgi:type I restriction enzyme R subunit
MKKARHYRGGYQLAGATELARELRAQETSAENILWQLLRNRQLQGFKFRRQHQIGSYAADFYCRKACLVVECDGSPHNSNEQLQHDQVRDAYMVSQGLRVLRFSNDQILNDTENVLREIAEYLVPSDEEASD